MENPLVSVLIPFKNSSKYLQECIDSIVSQSYTNWEAIFVNDHSEDASLEIVQNYSMIDNRIKVFTNKGNGIIAALRLAFLKSKGELITRMDSDDFMTSNKFEVMVGSLMEYGKGHVALGLVSYFSESGLGEGYQNYEKWLNRLTSNGSNYSEIYKECVIPSPCWMVHREDLENCNAFNENRYPEDYDLAYRFYESGLKCIPCQKVLHHWRDYSTRTSRTDMHYEQNYFIELKTHYFLKLNHDKSRPLVLWGAGSKGKNLARILIEKQVPFYWICDNPKKIGKHIYEQEIYEFNFLATLKNPQSIITVANPNAQIIINRFLQSKQMKAMQDFFFFC